MAAGACLMLPPWEPTPPIWGRSGTHTPISSIGNTNRDFCRSQSRVPVCLISDLGELPFSLMEPQESEKLLFKFKFFICVLEALSRIRWDVGKQAAGNGELHRIPCAGVSQCKPEDSPHEAPTSS